MYLNVAENVSIYNISEDCLWTSREATDILRENCFHEIFQYILKKLRKINKLVVKSKQISFAPKCLISEA